jgi:hypothetical protein
MWQNFVFFRFFVFVLVCVLGWVKLSKSENSVLTYPVILSLSLAFGFETLLEYKCICAHTYVHMCFLTDDLLRML